MPTDSLHRRLRALIGSRFFYAGIHWILIDVLADTDSIVLRNNSGDLPLVQADLYGSPVRLSTDTLTLPISGSDGQYSEQMKDLLSGRQT